MKKEIFHKLNIKIQNAVLISGITETERDKTVIDFLKQYGSINRLLSVIEPSAEFDEDMIIEYNSGTALAALTPLLPHTQCTRTQFLL